MVKKNVSRQAVVMLIVVFGEVRLQIVVDLFEVVALGVVLRIEVLLVLILLEVLLLF